MIRKKYLFIYSFFIICTFFMFINSSYAITSYTPINELTPDILRLLIDNVKIENSYNYLSGYDSLTNNFNNFYLTFNDNSLQTFCDTWNNTDFSSYADYLEQCVFIAGYNSSTPVINVYFNNNGIGNSFLHLKLGFSYDNFRVECIDDNSTSVASKFYSFSFNTAGTITSLGFIDIAYYGKATYLHVSGNNLYTYDDSSNFMSPVAFCYNIPSSIYTRYYGESTFYWRWLNGDSIFVVPEPEPTPVPSTPIPTFIPDGTIINSSGETTGSINLSGIEQGITGIQNIISGESQRIIDNQIQNTNTIVNTISGETQKITNTLTESADNTIDNTVITSGDIASTVDFSPINNNQQYTAITNFWYELLNSFSNALTNVNRSINIEFRGQIYTINLDDFTLNVPALLKIFLASFTTALVVVYISKNIKHIIEDIQTASIDNVACKLTEDFETNLF